MTGNFLGIVENVTFAADVSKKEPKFGVLADLSKTELLVYQKRNFCIIGRPVSGAKIMLIPVYKLPERKVI